MTTLVTTSRNQGGDNNKRGETLLWRRTYFNPHKQGGISPPTIDLIPTRQTTGAPDISAQRPPTKQPNEYPTCENQLPIVYTQTKSPPNMLVEGFRIY